MIYRNKKTETLYRHLAFGVDTTKARNGTHVIIYCPVQNENTIFVRDLDEFEAKFECEKK